MSAFVIFIRENVRSQSDLNIYSPLARDSFNGHDIIVRAAYGDVDRLEGAKPEGVVILEFPDMQSARSWYDGDAYQLAAAHRFKGADYRAFIVAGR